MKRIMEIMRYCLLFAGIIALFLGGYRLFAIGVYGYGPETYKIANHISAILVMLALGSWFIAYYQTHFTEIYNQSTLSLMKTVSLLCSILCWVRVVTAAVYFSYRLSEDPSIITYTYIVGDLLLWVVLGVFFFCYWQRGRKYNG